MKKKYYNYLFILICILFITSCNSKNENTNSINLNKKEGSFVIKNIITFDNENINISGNVINDNNKVYINSPGEYLISGESNKNSQIEVNVPKGINGEVILYLQNVNLKNDNEPIINILNAKNTIINLCDNSKNFFVQGEKSIRANEDLKGAAILSKDNLTITGNGNLKINANIYNAIQTSNDLIIESGNIDINSINHGIKGKDKVQILGGKINIICKNDAIKSDDEKNGNVEILGGDINIEADDKGIDSYNKISFLNGNININKASEGFQSNIFEMNGGIVKINSFEDGINTNGLKSILSINGGKLYIKSLCDGIDSNGDIKITSGEIFIEGPHTNKNNAIDFGVENGGKILISGGDILALGQKSLDGLESDNSIKKFLYDFAYDNTNKKNIIIKNKNTNEEILNYSSDIKEFNKLFFSSSKLELKQKYVLIIDEEEHEFIQTKKDLYLGKTID
ncbi:MAG: carbohydrate-binding domain-containing protein [Eubacteriales bacterium]|nr:carbohydrate-binding domain-containing protein [Eubacteriales bacterium]